MTEIHTLPFHLQLLVREYGHSTYQLILGLRQIEDVAERTRRAQGIVQLILRLQPGLRDQPDIQTRLWNHVHALAGEDVALDAPVPLHPPRTRTERPKRVEYPRQGPKFKAYGRGVEALVAKAVALEDPAAREQAAAQIGRTMKFLYRQHNKENAKDVTIIRHLQELSDGQLRLDPQAVAEQGLFEMGTGSAAPAGSRAAFVVPQPAARGENRDRGERRGETGNGGNGGKKRDKKRGKKFRQEPQQPPQ